MDWTIGQAQRRLADVIEQAAEEPQWIFRGNQLVAAVVDSEAFEEFLDWWNRQSRRTLADAFEELRRIRGDEVALEAPDRRNRSAPLR